MSRFTIAIIAVVGLGMWLCGIGDAHGQMPARKCATCNKEVPATIRLGDVCPHCGLRWTPPPRYHWEPISGSDKLAFCQDGQRVGVYDPSDQTYRRYNVHGKLSDPVAPPWKRSESDPQDQETQTAEPVKKAEPPPMQPPAERAQETPPIPPGASYAVGGILAVLAVLVGVMMQRRRKPEDGVAPSQSLPKEKPVSVDWTRRCDSWSAE